MLYKNTKAVQAPTFAVDPMWPRPLPNRWILGAVVGVAVDRRDHVWIVHRPSTLQPNETRSIWRAAPPVLEFDREGNVVSAWGGPGAGYEWPDLEHGIHVDDKDQVWIAGGGEKDSHLLKFTREGKFLFQIGKKGQGKGSNDTQNLGAAAHMVVDAAANELYVADGYVNHRVIVFDARLAPTNVTGALTASRRTTDTFKTRVNGCRGRSRVSSRMRIDRATTIPMVRRRRSFGLSTPCGSRAMDWSSLRPHQRSHSGVSQRRHFRSGSVCRQGHARQRIGVGHRFFSGRGAGVPDRARWH